MYWHRVSVFLLLAGLNWMYAASAVAAPALRLPLPFKRIDADPRKSYEISEEHGPWLILAATFIGESGQRQAHQLVLELRKRYKWPAYIYKKQFDYGETVHGLGVDSRGRPKKMRHMHAPQFEETAVLVGDFTAVDDPDAQKILERIKYAKPDTLNLSPSKPTNQSMAAWREIQRLVSPNVKMKEKGPMRSAFITRNPVLPDEYFVPNGPDKLIIELNRGLEYSLLDCEGNYTVRVATFRGESTWNVDDIERASREQMLGINAEESKLARGAAKARKLVAALRKRNVEAYQFHDRHESIVSIGSFDSYGQRRRDGRIEINPEIHRIMQSYGAQVQNLPGLPGAVTPRTLDGITLDAQPMPVQVPKISVVANVIHGHR